MKILGIQLDGIQTYTTPTFIPLSTKKTLIKGGNDKGKSVIKKALGVFADVYNKDDYRSLINYKKSQATIALYLSNRTILIAYLTPKTITYRLYTWQLDICLKEWFEYSQEIANLLGWITVSGEELCINLAESNVNVLVNTSRSTNTQIINSISTMPEIDLKMDNLRNALELAKANSKWADIELQVQKSYSNFNEEKYKNLKFGRNLLVTAESMLTNVSLVTKLLYSYDDLSITKKNLELTRIEKDKVLTRIMMTCIRLIKLKTMCKRGKFVLKTEIEMKQLTENFINASQIRNKCKVLSSQKAVVKKIENERLLIKDIQELLMLNLKRRGCIDEMNIDMGKKIRFLLNNHRMKTKLINDKHKVDVFKEEIMCLSTMKNISNIIVELTKNKTEKLKFDFCPLCHQKIEHNHRTHILGDEHLEIGE